jgi:hypothetical protein
MSTDAPDVDPDETAEWIEALTAVVRSHGKARGQYLLERLEAEAQQLGIVAHVAPYSAYRNTIPLEHQGCYPGDLALEERLTAIMRWNALAMVVRANQASASSAATSRATPRRPRSSRSGSTTSSAPRRPAAAATWCSSSRIRRPASMRAPSSRAASPRSSSQLPPGDRRGRRALLLSASVADAGLLAVPDRVDGPRADQRDLPGALHALPRAPRSRRPPPGGTSGACSATARWTSRSRSRADAGRAREARQPAPSSSTATCSASMARCAATARSSRSSSRCSPAPAGT